MNPKFIAAMGGILLLAGCAGTSPSPYSNEGYEGPAPSEPDLPGGPVSPLIDNRPKLTYAEANRLTPLVKVGMRQEQIERMFGRPDRAAKQIYGRATGTPWEGLVWEWVFADVSPAKVLTVTFQRTEGGWIVHHGSWNE